MSRWRSWRMVEWTDADGCSCVWQRNDTGFHGAPHACARPCLLILLLLFKKKKSAATATTHSSDISYLRIVLMKTNSSRHRCMYAQAGRGVQEERGCKHQVLQTGQSASSIVDEISYLNGEIGSCTCCVSSFSDTLGGKRRPNEMEGARPEMIYAMRFGLSPPEKRVAFNAW